MNELAMKEGKNAIDFRLPGEDSVVVASTMLFLWSRVDKVRAREGEGGERARVRRARESESESERERARARESERERESHMAYVVDIT